MSKRSTKRLTSDHTLPDKIGLIAIPQTDRTSTRCRATHDVPYTLRCVLERDHIKSELSEHTDRDGRTWV